ncbi:hypothetical protein MPSEU_000153200 [Mayamaea pseudoterrestris]|nr:hypothetical protein MPSEU_000153200 [Mayamaea pseudoterrestris]
MVAAFMRVARWVRYDVVTPTCDADAYNTTTPFCAGLIYAVHQIFPSSVSWLDCQVFRGGNMFAGTIGWQYQATAAAPPRLREERIGIVFAKQNRSVADKPMNCGGVAARQGS